MRRETRPGRRCGRLSARLPPEMVEQMSRWRWVLFAAMARLEIREDVYWRFPIGNSTALPQKPPFSGILNRLARRLRP